VEQAHLYFKLVKVRYLNESTNNPFSLQKVHLCIGKNTTTQKKSKLSDKKALDNCINFGFMLNVMGMSPFLIFVLSNSTEIFQLALGLKPLINYVSGVRNRRLQR